MIHEIVIEFHCVKNQKIDNNKMKKNTANASILGEVFFALNFVEIVCQLVFLAMIFPIRLD